MRRHRIGRIGAAICSVALVAGACGGSGSSEVQALLDEAATSPTPSATAETPSTPTATADPTATATATASEAAADSSPTASPEADEPVVTDAELAEIDAALAELLAVEGPDGTPNGYDRDTYQPGGWPDTDGDCQNDRHEVLIRASLVDVTLSPDGCFVEDGRWQDPYTGQTFFHADDVTIDHFVPLAHAHRVGGWAWDDATRQAFAADLTDPAALWVVDPDMNNAKSDRGPELWRPPRRQAWCSYATAWIGQKVRWQLPIASDAEADALEEMLDTCTEPDSDGPRAPGLPEGAPLFASTAAVTLAPVATATSTPVPTPQPTAQSTPPPTPAPTPTAPLPTPTPTAAPPPPPAQQCDPNYTPCVPIDSDVDCAGGSGNGPSYVQGPVTVIGFDIYGLDGDNDGIGCE